MLPTQLGRFTLLGELGSGGMGRVYRAHDSTLRRDVAIKILHENTDSTPGRLLAEARSASTLNHPHICTVYDVGEVDGAQFIAMELVEGTRLSDRIGPGGLPPGEALDIAVQIAGALAYAHEHNVVHGDLKGHNVVVTPGGQIKLLDFGLAQTPAPASLESITHLQSAQPADAALAGTLPFMAPETLRGAALSPAADVWAFGVLLCEILTGTRPFTGNTGYELAASILNNPPQVSSSLPAPVQAVIAKCLEKSVVRRYASGREVLAALEPLRSGHAALIPAASVRRSVANRGRTAVVAAVVLALVGGLAWLWPRMTASSAPMRPVSSLVVLPLENLSHNKDEDFFAEGMTDALITDLSRLPTLTVISRTSAMRYKALGKSAREIADELHVGAIVDGSVMRSGGEVRINVRLVDAAADRNIWGREYTRELKDVLALQSEVARAIATEISASFAPADEVRLTSAQPVVPEANEEFLKGRYYWSRRTPDALMEAIRHFNRALELQPRYAQAEAGLAQCYVVLPIFPLGVKSPIEAFPLAVNAAERAIAIDDRVAGAHVALGYARLYLLGFPAAEKSFQQALAINRGDGTAHFWYAAALSSTGQFDAALEHAKEAAALDPVSPILRAGVSWMHHLARRFDLEVEHARQALELDPNFLVAQFRLSSGLLHQGKYDEAVAVIEKARELTKGSPDLVAAAGYAYGRAGRRREAQAALGELKGLIASNKRYVSPYDVGLIYIGLGNRDEAFRWLERAIDERHPVAVFIGVEPDLDPLRSDNRFASLVARARR